jgi:hypothetical protein
MEHVMRPAPAGGRVDPVPRRRGHQDIEAPAAVVLLLERRRPGLDVAERGEPLAARRTGPPNIAACGLLPRPIGGTARCCRMWIGDRP